MRRGDCGAAGAASRPDGMLRASNVKLRDLWVGLAATLFSAIAIAVVRIHGGDPQEVAWRIGMLIPIAAVSLLSLVGSAYLSNPRRSAIPWFWGVIAAGGIANFLLPYALPTPGFNPVTMKLNGFFGKFLPLQLPTGSDFLNGVYLPARAFSSSASAYPPFTLIIGKPFTLLGFSSAYLVQVGVLVALGIASAALSAVLAMKVVHGPDSDDSPRISRAQVAILMCAWLLSSYGFVFEVERGNIDLYALFFSLLAVWALTRKHDNVWLPAVLLAVAINIKLYPAILVVLLFWRYRWRAVVPVLVSNAVLLLVAGPTNAWSFFKNLTALGGAPSLWAWVGNHSAASFTQGLALRFPGMPVTAVGLIALLVPLCLWAVTMFVLFRRKFSASGAVLAAAASVPVMGALPSVSHDYKLVLLVFPMTLIVVAVLAMRRMAFSRWVALLGLAGIELVMLDRSPLVSAPAFLANKYPLLVLVQLTILVLLYLRRDRASVDRAANSA